MKSLNPSDNFPLCRTETMRTIGGQFPIEITLFDSPPHDNPDPVSENFILCLTMRGTVQVAFNFGDGWSRAVVSPGSFMPITPPGTLGELMINAPHRHMMLALPKRAIAGVSASHEDFGPLHDNAFRDKLVAQLCMGLWEEAKFADTSNDLFADCARAALVAALHRRARQKSTQPQKLQVFSPQIWKRIESEIATRLGEPLTVGMLAALSGMRETRFLHAFKQKTGTSPYRYVLQKRIEKAVMLLADPKLDIAEIALTTGFADQAHMTMTFSRLLCRTPGDVRRYSNLYDRLRGANTQEAGHAH